MYVFAVHERGTYDYYCMAHPWMTGEIIVVAEGTLQRVEEREPEIEPELEVRQQQQ